MRIDISGQLTIYFDCPFWVGVFEIYSDNTIKTSRIVFGSEPKDAEIYNFILCNYYNLKFSKPMTLDNKNKKISRVNPKRMQRQIKKQIVRTGVGTKAQQSISRQREETKIQNQKISKSKKEMDMKIKYNLRKQKKKEKHRGH